MNTDEKIVAQLDDIEENGIKEIEVHGLPILLSRKGNTISAFGACCSHYGAPLADGVVLGDHFLCPWHHARFSRDNGEVEEPPGLDSLTCFPVRVEGNDIVLSIPENAEIQREPTMSSKNPAADSRTFVLLGGGAAGAFAAETLRREGFEGRIIMISKEGRLPYDRTLLSKKYLSAEKTKGYIPLRSSQFYERHGIEVLLNRLVEQVDPAAQVIYFADGQTLAYDALLLATGGAPRHLDVAGHDLDNIFMLRTPEHADAIIAAAEGASKAAIIGAGFIATECAAGLRERNVEVTMIAPEAVPLTNVLGMELGGLVQAVHEENKVHFRLNSKVHAFTGTAGLVKTVILESGEKVSADFVIAAIGVQPVTDYLNIPKSEDGGVEVDADMRVKSGDGTLFAAGDIAVFPSSTTGSQQRIEHWRVAQQQGMIAARAMLGKSNTQKWIPFFWTNQYDLKLRYVGFADTWDELIIDGDLEAQDFVIYYIQNGNLAAAAGVGRNQAMAALEECLIYDKVPSLTELRQGGIEWVEQLHRLCKVQ